MNSFMGDKMINKFRLKISYNENKITSENNKYEQFMFKWKKGQNTMLKND